MCLNVPGTFKLSDNDDSAYIHEKCVSLVFFTVLWYDHE